jgi:hypothetical protein
MKINGEWTLAVPLVKRPVDPVNDFQMKAASHVWSFWPKPRSRCTDGSRVRFRAARLDVERLPSPPNQEFPSD